MVNAKGSEWYGFWPKAMLGAFGILFTLLVSYFVWLGAQMVDVRQRVVAIELAVRNLETSRTLQRDNKAESNRQRIDALEVAN